MSAEYSVEEVRATKVDLKSGEYDGTTIMTAWIMLEAYANRIEADEGAKDVVTRLLIDALCNAALGHDNYGTDTQDRVRSALLAVWPVMPVRADEEAILYAHPPAQVAQVPASPAGVPDGWARDSLLPILDAAAAGRVVSMAAGDAARILRQMIAAAPSAPEGGEVE